MLGGGGIGGGHRHHFKNNNDDDKDSGLDDVSHVEYDYGSAIC